MTILGLPGRSLFAHPAGLVGSLILLLIMAGPGHGMSAPAAAGMPHARVSMSRGRRVAGQQEDLSEELQRYLRALRAARRAGDRNEEINALVYVALTYEKLGDRRSAVDFYEQALKLSPPGSAQRATVLSSLGDDYKSLGQYRQALNYYTQELALWRTLKKQDSEAQTYFDIGDTYLLLGNNQEALKNLDSARALCQLIGQPDNEARMLGIMGSIAPTQRETLLYYNQSLSIWERLGDEANQADVLRVLGFVYGNFDDREALRYFERARTSWQKAGNRGEEAKILLDIAIAHVWLGESQEALESYDQALRLWQALGNRDGEAETLTRLGWTYYWSGDKKKALEQLLKAASLWRGQPDKAAIPLGHAGIIYASLGEKHRALDTVGQVLKVSRDLSPLNPTKALLLYDAGRIYHLIGNQQKALHYWQQEAAIHRANEYPRGEADAFFTIGTAYESQGDLRKALEYYLRSLDAGEKVRTGAGVDELKIKLEEKSANVYQRAMLLQLRLAPHSAEAFKLSERARARAFLDQVGNARLELGRGGDDKTVLREQSLREQIGELESRFAELQQLPQASYDEREVQGIREQLAAKRREYERTLIDLKLENPGYASLHSVDVMGLSEVQKLLDAETTLLSFVVTPDVTLAFIVTRGGYEPVELKVGEQELFEAISEARASGGASLTLLYNKLIAPLKGYLKTPLIGIVPHGVLHYLPFAALNDGLHFLDEEHVLFYLPSASALPLIRKKHKPEAGRMLALAQSSAAGLPDLRYVDTEAVTVARLYKGEVLVNDKATESAFRARAGGYAILHIAAHAKFDPQSPLFSSISLAPGGGQDGSLQVHEIYSLDLKRADLVVLSACSTQIGAQGRGDDVIGLNRAFIYAGAPTVIASLWAIDDETTVELMESFYKHLREGMSKAAALHAAQCAARQAHPNNVRNWAAFVLMGDPGTGVIDTRCSPGGKTSGEGAH